jgi:hypothetical protein
MSRSEVQIRLSTAHYAHYAHAVLLGIFVSVANKGCPDQLPKLDVAGSIPVARSKFQNRTANSKSDRGVKPLGLETS